MTKATGTIELASWNEETYHAEDGTKLTRAEVTQTFTGDLDGRGSVQWLMSYRRDGTAHFVGLQRIEASLAGRSGSFVVESIGDFDGHVATGRWSVVPGTGHGDLERIRGAGGFGAPHGPTAEYELDYELD